MRHKYDTQGIVLARTPLGEANAYITFITPTLGLVRARAQGLRKPGAKLAGALTTFAESEIILVRGREGWRVAGSVLITNWFVRLQHSVSRTRAARVTGLLLRLVAGEAHDAELYTIMQGFFEALTALPPDSHEAAELLAVLRILATLGLDAGDIPGEAHAFVPESLSTIADKRSHYVSRINHGIAASGL